MQQKRMLNLQGSHVSQISICQSTPVINYSDQSNRGRGEEMISEKEGLKTSISITSVNSCNEFLRPADRRGGKRYKQRERSPEGETCTLDIYMSTNSFDY